MKVASISMFGHDGRFVTFDSSHYPTNVKRFFGIVENLQAYDCKFSTGRGKLAGTAITVTVTFRITLFLVKLNLSEVQLFSAAVETPEG